MAKAPAPVPPPRAANDSDDSDDELFSIFGDLPAIGGGGASKSR